ncbi:hypothetical protein FH972_015525 [Carpinus fangiana]|uniref:At4g15545-like C-terminal domain-containing protein n=1 Tax=Carpinus fangiana TaxID=176857 RepID=A0A5N6RE69_9ROSI|nr:hypothetical protein FH972_015525 [Carpinus fangiana]
MLAKESCGSNFGLPEEVLEVLPSDPFEQLDVARKITSVALSTRVSALESESSDLRAQLAEKDRIIAELQAQVESLDASLSETADQLARADEEKESLVKENASLSNTVKKLNRDVSKLEVFRKTLMRSLQEDDENSARAPEAVAKIQSHSSLSSVSQIGEEDATFRPSRYSSIQSQTSEVGNSFAEDRETGSRPRISHGLLLASQTTTPHLTPPGSPPSLSASVSPTKTSKPASPRRHSLSFATSRGMFDDRSSMFSSMHSSHHSSVSSSDTGSQSALEAAADLITFLLLIRSRLSYEQFGAFLANVKELNAHKQTKEETLQKAEEIFGSENKDLYTIFEGLITRNAH